MTQDKDQVKDAWLIMKAHGKEEDQEVHLLGHEVTGMVNSEISRIVNSNLAKKIYGILIHLLI